VPPAVVAVGWGFPELTNWKYREAIQPDPVPETVSGYQVSEPLTTGAPVIVAWVFVGTTVTTL
jgi:hypothetical protein